MSEFRPMSEISIGDIHQEIEYRRKGSESSFKGLLTEIGVRLMNEHRAGHVVTRTVYDTELTFSIPDKFGSVSEQYSDSEQTIKNISQWEFRLAQ